MEDEDTLKFTTMFHGAGLLKSVWLNDTVSRKRVNVEILDIGGLVFE